MENIVCPKCSYNGWSLHEETKTKKLKGYLLFICKKCQMKVYNKQIKRKILKNNWVVLE